MADVVSLFSFEAVSLSYDGRHILDDFNLTIRQGEKVVLKGASGSGKSTLLKLLLGLVQPDSGVTKYEGTAISPEVAKKVRCSVSYVSQSVGWEAGRVDSAIEDFFSIRAMGHQPEESNIKSVFQRLRLSPELLPQKIQDLSGGERHRVGLAVGLLLGRPVFLLDEPTAALDVSLKRKVADLFLENKDWTVVAAAHDPAWYEEREVTLVDLDS